MTHTFVAFQVLILISFVPLLHVSSFGSMLSLLVEEDGWCIINYRYAFVFLLLDKYDFAKSANTLTSTQYMVPFMRWLATRHVTARYANRWNIDLF